MGVSDLITMVVDYENMGPKSAELVTITLTIDDIASVVTLPSVCSIVNSVGRSYSALSLLQRRAQQWQQVV